MQWWYVRSYTCTCMYICMCVMHDLSTCMCTHVYICVYTCVHVRMIVWGCSPAAAERMCTHVHAHACRAHGTCISTRQLGSSHCALCPLFPPHTSHLTKRRRLRSCCSLLLQTQSGRPRPVFTPPGPTSKSNPETCCAQLTCTHAPPEVAISGRISGRAAIIGWAESGALPALPGRSGPTPPKPQRSHGGPSAGPGPSTLDPGPWTRLTAPWTLAHGPWPVPPGPAPPPLGPGPGPWTCAATSQTSHSQRSGSGEARP